MNRKLAALLVTVSALAVAVPVAQGAKGGAKGGNPAAHGQVKKAAKAAKPAAPAAPTTAKTHPAQSHKCMPHNVGFVESGTVDATTASSLAAGTDGTWSGTVVVDVNHSNHWAAADKGKTVTQTLTSVKHVQLPTGTTSLTAGERVKLIGKLAVVAKKCTAPATAATPVFSKVVVHPAAA